MSAETHISSLVVHVRPECQVEASARIAALGGAEIHGASAQGKLVVVLETPSEGDILAHITAINEMPGIIATSLIYHEIDRADREEATDA
jgi:nitrate reductase NapD